LVCSLCVCKLSLLSFLYSYFLYFIMSSYSSPYLYFLSIFLSALRCPPISTLFPYTSLFRSPLLIIIHLLLFTALLCYFQTVISRDRKSTRLNSSHVSISYAVFCLKKTKLHCSSSPSN